MMRFSRIRSTKPKASILAIAILALLAIGGATASGAQALEWNVGAHTLTERGVASEGIAGSGSGIQITSTVLGAPFEASCSATTEGSIAQGGAGASAITLSGCNVTKPATCAIKGSPSIAANVQLVEIGGVVYQRYVPKTEAGFTVITLTGCVDSGSYQLKGSFAGLGSQTERLVNQPTNFSAAINSAAGTSLTLGKSPATLAGTVAQHLSGPLAGRDWQAGGTTKPFNWVATEQGEFGPGARALISISGGPVQFVTGSSGATLKWSCSSVEGRESRILYGGGAEGALHFAGCKVSEPVGCIVSKEINTNPLKATLRNIAGFDYETFAPKTGQVLATLSVNGCSFAGAYQVTGSTTVKGGQDGVIAVSQPFEFSPAADTLAGTSLKFGASPLTLTGATNWQLLTGAGFGIN
jgi:hypothetical protein